MKDQKYRLGKTGEEIELGRRVGEGGEGTVWTVQGSPEHVVKIYREMTATEGQRTKVTALSQMDSEKLLEVAAWPLDYVVDANGDTVGFTMQYIRGSMPLFSSYQIKTRMQKLPQANFQFLVRAARNLATCVHRVHEAGLVIGDLNESNTLIDGKAMVKLIDTDSIQMVIDGKCLVCPVAKLELLAPEMHNKDLEEVPRERNHDLFPLAVLIFQILGFGRHPFAGRHVRGEDFSLEGAIQQGHYAYTKRRETPIRAVKGITLDHLPPQIIELFEDTFDPTVRQRPSALTWFEELHKLEQTMSICEKSEYHRHWSGSSFCPWCQLESVWKITLFGDGNSQGQIVPRGRYDSESILQVIEQIPQPLAKVLPAMEIDHIPAKPINFLELAGGKITQFAPYELAILAVCAAIMPSQAIFIGAIALFLLCIAFLSGMPQRRRRVMKEYRAIYSDYLDLRSLWAKHGKPQEFEEMQKRVLDLVDNIDMTPEKLEEFRTDQMKTSYSNLLQMFLRKYSVLAAEIPSAGAETKRRLTASGVSTAADVSEERIKDATFLKPSAQVELLDWRNRLEKQFWETSHLALTPEERRIIEAKIKRAQDNAVDEIGQLEAKMRQESTRLYAAQSAILQQFAETEAKLKLLAPEFKAIEAATGKIFPV